MDTAPWQRDARRAQRALRATNRETFVVDAHSWRHRFGSSLGLAARDPSGIKPRLRR
jgi:hypothetical protein